MLASLLKEALNRQNPIGLAINLSDAFLNTIPEIKNLKHFGCSEMGLLPIHPSFSWRLTRSENSTLPQFWAIEDIEDLRSWRYTYDGPWWVSREVLTDLTESPEYQI